MENKRTDSKVPEIYKKVSKEDELSNKIKFTDELPKLEFLQKFNRKFPHLRSTPTKPISRSSSQIIDYQISGIDLQAVSYSELGDRSQSQLVAEIPLRERRSGSHDLDLLDQVIPLKERCSASRNSDLVDQEMSLKERRSGSRNSDLLDQEMSFKERRSGSQILGSKLEHSLSNLSQIVNNFNPQKNSSVSGMVGLDLNDYLQSDDPSVINSSGVFSKGDKNASLNDSAHRNRAEKSLPLHLKSTSYQELDYLTNETPEVSQSQNYLISDDSPFTQNDSNYFESNAPSFESEKQSSYLDNGSPFLQSQSPYLFSPLKNEYSESRNEYSESPLGRRHNEYSEESPLLYQQDPSSPETQVLRRTNDALQHELAEMELLLTHNNSEIDVINQESKSLRTQLEDATKLLGIRDEMLSESDELIRRGDEELKIERLKNEELQSKVETFTEELERQTINFKNERDQMRDDMDCLKSGNVREDSDDLARRLEQFEEVLRMNVQLRDSLEKLSVGNKVKRGDFACQTDTARSDLVDAESQSTANAAEIQISLYAVNKESQTLLHQLVDVKCQTDILREPLPFTHSQPLVLASTQTEEIGVEVGLEEISGVYLTENIHTLEQLSVEIFAEESPEEKIDLLQSHLKALTAQSLSNRDILREKKHFDAEVCRWVEKLRGDVKNVRDSMEEVGIEVERGIELSKQVGLLFRKESVNVSVQTITAPMINTGSETVYVQYHTQGSQIEECDVNPSELYRREPKRDDIPNIDLSEHENTTVNSKSMQKKKLAERPVSMTNILFSLLVIGATVTAYKTQQFLSFSWSPKPAMKQPTREMVLI